MPRDPAPEVRQQACDDECLDTCVVPCECICHQRAAVAGAPRLTKEEWKTMDALTTMVTDPAMRFTSVGGKFLRDIHALLARLTREEG